MNDFIKALWALLLMGIGAKLTIALLPYFAGC